MGDLGEAVRNRLAINCLVFKLKRTVSSWYFDCCIICPVQTVSKDTDRCYVDKQCDIFTNCQTSQWIWKNCSSSQVATDTEDLVSCLGQIYVQM